MIGFATWLLGSKAGRIAALVALAVASFALLMARMYAEGKKAEQLKQTRQSLDDLRARVKLNANISTLSPDDRSKRISRWAVPDDK